MSLDGLKENMLGLVSEHHRLELKQEGDNPYLLRPGVKCLALVVVQTRKAKVISLQ